MFLGCLRSVSEVLTAARENWRWSELNKPGKIWMSLCDSKMMISPATTVFLDDNLMSAI